MSSAARRRASNAMLAALEESRPTQRQLRPARPPRRGGRRAHSAVRAGRGVRRPTSRRRSCAASPAASTAPLRTSSTRRRGEPGPRRRRRDDRAPQAFTELLGGSQASLKFGWFPGFRDPERKDPSHETTHDAAHPRDRPRPLPRRGRHGRRPRPGAGTSSQEQGAQTQQAPSLPDRDAFLERVAAISRR